MSLSFLVPAFLIGLTALAVPVLIHLTRRHTRQAVPFPSLMFLRRLPRPSTRRRRIHRWPLLLLRCAALLLLVLAFARPFLARGGASVLPLAAGGREVVVLLDRSYSMGYGDRWARAAAAAREAIGRLGPGDRATLLLFDSRVEAATPATSDRALLRSALAEAAPGPRATRYAPALRYAQRILGSSPLPRRELVLISDFQRVGWDADAADIGALRLPAGTTVTPVSVGGATPANLGVASLAFRRSLSAGRERVGVTARLTRRGDARPGVAPVVLEIGGRPVETRTVALGAEGAVVEFAPVTLPQSGAVRGTVRLAGDSLPADDVFHFVISPDQRIGVLVVQGPGARAGASYYLERALALGDAPGFRVEIRPAAALRAADLAAARVVILDQAPLPGGTLGRRLRAAVERGVGLVAIPGESRGGGWEGVLPRGAGDVVDRSAEGGTALGYIDLGHPVFEPFSAPRSGDFTAARVLRYRRVDSGDFHRVLARFGDGGVALAERPLGLGRVLVWTSTLDNRWNDLVLQPVFLPFLHQVVKYAAGYAPARPWLTVGDPFDPGAFAAGRSSVVLTPSGERVPIERAGPLALEEAGFYEVREGETGARGGTVAVNVDPGESDLAGFEPRELASALAAAPAPAGGAGETAPLTLAEREQRQSAWWYLVVLAFVLLAVETVLSNRWSGRSDRAVVG